MTAFRSINALFYLVAFLTANCFGQIDPIALQKPTGIFPVGTVTYEWVDESRNYAFSSYAGDKRTVPVQFWYPSVEDSNSKRAPYTALSRDYSHATTNSSLYTEFSKKIDKSPLILMSPGRGTERFAYTTIAEELASNGFIVAAIDMPEIGYVIYNNGFVAKPSPKFQPPRGLMAGPYEKVDEFFAEPTAIGLRDIEFVVSKIGELAKSDTSNRFRNKIDLKNVGVFGHSLGGRIAGAYVAKHKNVKAYISMEGIPPRNIRYEGLIEVPTAMLVSSGTYPYAKVNYDSLVQNRNCLVYMVELDKFGHNSVTDFPLITPQYFKYEIDSRKGLAISREIVRSFFAEHLLKSGSFREMLGQYPEIKATIHKRP